MSSEITKSTNAHVRRTRVHEFTAELDLRTRVVRVLWQRGTAAAVNIGSGTWEPLPAPLGDLRGRIAGEGMHRRTRALFEYGFGRGDPSWSYADGPWVAARGDALDAGLAAVDADSLAKVMWLFYRDRWPLELADGCGWGPGGHAPLIAVALAEPGRMRARWDLLILTGGLRWRTEDGSLDDMTGEPLPADFYT